MLQTVNADTIDVDTPKGVITGIGVPVTGLEEAKTYQFRRIPYAKPPTGDLRFAKPVPFGEWKGKWNGTYFGPSCMQIPDPFAENPPPNREMSEDCLLLNIYVPNKIDVSRRKAVMIWIHGGAYEGGTGMVYDGSYLAAKADVIVVTINYRLGLFGFLTLNDTVAPGNFGLWDQILAMRWISESISAFGGDPSSVTIFGESAGGFSVGLQSLIPSNKGLFQRVIAESGVSNSYLATVNKLGKDLSVVAGEALGCHLGVPPSTSKFIRCMRAQSAQRIVNITQLAKNSMNPIPSIHFFMPIAPVVDGDLFTETPEEILSQKNSNAFNFYSTLDIMVGNVNSEGLLALLTISEETQKELRFNLSNGLPYDIFRDRIVKSFTDDYFERNVRVKDAICKEYCVENNETEQARQMVDLYTDFFFIVPTVETLSSHTFNRNNRSSYQYIFTQKSARPFGPKRPAWFVGTGHGGEIVYLFGLREFAAHDHGTVTADDLVLSDQMVAYWSNFAETG